METSSLKRIVNKYTETSLIIRILIGMAIGVVLALAVPQFTGIKILGDLFVGALKAIAPLLVCLLIMSSLAQTKEGHNGNMKTVVILYMFSTIMGAIVAVAGSFLFPLAITITVITLAAAHTLGISVSIPTAIVLSILATLSACGASGIAGGSLLLIPVACSLFGISNDIAMQVVGVGFIIGVIQDSCETALNSSSDVLLTATAEFMQWRKAGKEIPF